MNVSGKVIIQVKDSNTMEVKRVIEQDNAVTLPYFMTGIMGGPDFNSNWNKISGTTGLAPAEIAISGRIIHPDVKTISHYAIGSNGYPISTDHRSNDMLIERQDSREQEWTIFNDVEPYYAEYVGRFDSPAATRVINTIATVNNNAALIATLVKLTTPCTQEPGEVLDITYRIQFFDNSSIGSNQVPVSANITNAMMQSIVYGQGRGYPMHAYSRPVASPGENQIATINDDVARTLARIGTAGGVSGVNRFSEYQIEYNNEMRKEDYVGQIIRSVGYGSVSSTVAIDLYKDDGIIAGSTIWNNFVNDDFPYKPIQPIQNHNKDAVEWGLDVDFLASSQGSISVDGSAWEQQDWPEFWRVEFKNTGEIGDARYFLRTRATMGFADSTYKVALNRLDNFWASGYDDDHQTVVGGHGARQPLNKEEYGPDSLVKWDASGISLMVINTSRIYSFDAATTPSLPVTNVKQVAVDKDKNVWVACANTGLYVIKDIEDKNNVSITKLTEAQNNVFTGSGNRCFGVAVGYNDSLWALFDGAISQTMNPNDVTPTFVHYNEGTSPAINHVGFTDNNWATAKYIRVDRNSPTDELLIVRKDANRDQLVWWSTEGNTFEGPTSLSIFETVYPRIQTGDQYGRYTVSRKGSLWFGFDSRATDNMSLYEWGQISKVYDLTNRNEDASASPAIAYDYYDTPYCANFDEIAKAGGGTTFGPSLTLPDNIKYGSPQNFSSSTPHGTWHSFEDSRGGGMLIMAPTTNFGAGSQYFRETPYLYQLNVREDAFLDALAGQHSPYEEVTWNKYHWNTNTSSWELNYYADAVDIANFVSGPFPAKRHNFDTEDHRFTGRSLIDITGSFAATNFAATTDATLVFSLQPQEKITYRNDNASAGEKKQEYQRAIFDVSTKDRRLKLVWDNSIQGNMVLWEDTTSTVVASTPANIGTGFYRLVVSISGTSVNIYLDGVQLGTTITLGQAVDWSNAGGDLLAYVGSRVYLWEYRQRNSPWPSDFYRGKMENVQVWTSAWDATDVSNDYANINGVITSKPASSLVSRFELTETILETKVTHVAPEQLIDGVTIGFVAGANPDSFTEDDYFTFGVVDGILKDNSLSMKSRFNIHLKPVNFEFDQFLSGAGDSIISNSVDLNVIEPAYFVTTDGPTAASRESNLDVRSAAGTIVIPGQVGINNDFSVYYGGSDSPYGGTVIQPMVGDGYIEAMPSSNDNVGMFGLLTNFQNTIASGDETQLEHAFHFKSTGNVCIQESNSEVQTNITTYTVDDIFRIRRTGTTVTYLKVDGNGTETLLYTSLVASSGTVYARAYSPGSGYGFCRANINYDRPANILTIGDSTLETGMYNPDAIKIDTLDVNATQIKIDGVDADVVISTEPYGSMLAPAPGQVVLNGNSGWLLFNSADATKTVTGTVSVIYDKL